MSRHSVNRHSVNRVVLTGYLTQDPELRALPSGLRVCSMRIACNSPKRVEQGDYQEKPHFFNVNVYGDQAEDVDIYTRKGRSVAIEGRLVWREWKDPDRGRREAVTVAADAVQFLDDPDERSEISEA